MKSGLRDRNNKMIDTNLTFRTIVSMKSGLGDRNNKCNLMLLVAQEHLSQ